MRSWMALALPAPPIKVVSSLPTSTRRARPRSASVNWASDRPASSLTTLPPVSTAMSCSRALRRSPKPGALTAQVLMVPRKVLSTIVASASPSMSSAITSSGRPAFSTSSSSGSRSCSEDSFLSCSRIAASSSTAFCRSGLLMK